MDLKPQVHAESFLLCRNNKSGELNKLVWDIDHVEKLHLGRIIEMKLVIRKEKFQEHCGDTGTLLVWEKCDRLLQKNYQEAGGTTEKEP